MKLEPVWEQPVGTNCRIWGTVHTQIQGVFLHWASPKKLKYGKPNGVVGGVQPGERNQRQVSHFEMHFRDC